ncbi:MAG TPA: glycosyltransferase family 4 protein [Candidatus Dormibacteraeota bacterium]|nr:glycosyltransferase family 4 protein [Candidatus Dormibacteraeota bacterium]
MTRSPIAILLYSSTRVRYGVEEHMLTLLRELPRTYFRFYLACSKALEVEFGPDLPSDVEVLSLSMASSTRVPDALRLAKFVRERKIDIVHSHMFFSSRFASPIARACGVPVILETPHVAENWRRGWLKSSFALDRAVGRCVDYFIAVSQANASYLIHKKGLPKEKIVVIRNGCELSRFASPLDSRSELRNQRGLSESAPLVLVPARLEPQKGHRVLLEALPDVRREFPQAQFLFLGEGSLKKELQDQVAALSLEEMVKFIGFQADVANWYALADFTVLPSFYEGLPLVAIESLAASRSIVATSVDGTPEVVVNGRTGLTVAPGNPAELSKAICNFLRNPALADTYGRQGREWVEQEFSQEKQVRETSDLYVRSCEEKRRAAHVPKNRAAEEWSDAA